MRQIADCGSIDLTFRRASLVAISQFGGMNDACEIWCLWLDKNLAGNVLDALPAQRAKQIVMMEAESSGTYPRSWLKQCWPPYHTPEYYLHGGLQESISWPHRTTRRQLSNGGPIQSAQSDHEIMKR